MPIVKKVIFSLLIIFFLSSFSKNFLGYTRSLAFYDSYKKEYSHEKKRNNELKTMLVKTTDQYEIEKTIRNKLNLMKDKEVAIILPETTPTPFVPTPTSSPVYHQWYSTFFEKN